MTDPLSLFSPEMLPDTPNAISSPGLESGPMPRASPASRIRDPFGAGLALVSHSASPEGAAGPPIQGTCGRTYFASSVPAGPLRSWENRLRTRLAGIGSTESALIWRERRISAEVSVSVLAPSTVLTNGNESTGARWPTPNVPNGGRVMSPEAVQTGKKADGSKAQINLETVMTASRWSTARASDGDKGGPNQQFGAGGTPLPAQMHQARWRTPQANAKGAYLDPDLAQARAEGGHQTNLEDQMVAARWATPTARDFRSGLASPETHAKNARPLVEQMTPPASTPTTNGLLA